MKTILITGGAGFIATNLIKNLIKLKSTSKIISIDNYYSGSTKNHIKSSKIIYYRCSTSKINIFKKLKNINFDTVFHFGEFSRIVPSFKNYDDCFKSNFIGTYEVIKFCLNKNARLVYSASSSTFGSNKFLSPYSWSKYNNNELIKNFSNWFNLKYNIVYFYNVYGSNHICKGKMASVLGVFEDQYKKNLPLTVVKPGTQKRDFTHVDDIIRGVILSVKKTINSEFHIGSGENYSILQVVKFYKHPFIFVDERPGERFNSLANYNLAFKKLGYKPKNNLKNYIQNFIQNA